MRFLSILALSAAMLMPVTIVAVAADAPPACTVFGPNATDCVTPNTPQASIANHTTTPIPKKCDWEK